MTNIGVKYKLHQVLSLVPLPPHQPPFSLLFFISFCCRLLTFSAFFNLFSPKTLGSIRESVSQLFAVWKEVGVNKDIMICEMHTLRFRSSFSLIPKHTTSFSCCWASFLLSVLRLELIQPFSSTARWWCHSNAIQKFLLRHSSVFLKQFFCPSFSVSLPVFHPWFLSALLSLVLAWTKEWRMFRLMWSE